MINKKLQAKPRVELPDQATVGEVLKLRSPTVNVFSGLALLHFWKGDSDAPFTTSFNIIDWETISFTVPDKVGEVTVRGVYSTVTALPTEARFSARLTIVPA